MYYLILYMIEELCIEKRNIDEEYKEEIINLNNRIKILSKNMFIIYENFYKQHFIITNPYYKYNIELYMKYISLDIIYKCIERLNIDHNIFEENIYRIYKSNDQCENILLNIKYFENKYLFLEYYKNNIIEEIPISKNNLLKLLLYICNSDVYKLVKKLYL